VLALVNTSKNRDNCICLPAMDDAVTVDYSIQSYFLQFASTMRRQSSRIAAFVQVECKANVLLAKVCLHCTNPDVAGSS